MYGYLRPGLPACPHPRRTPSAQTENRLRFLRGWGLEDRDTSEGLWRSGPRQAVCARYPGLAVLAACPRTPVTVRTDCISQVLEKHCNCPLLPEL